MLRNVKLGGLLKLTDWKQIERVKIFQIFGRKTFSFVSKLSKELPALKASGEKIESQKFSFSMLSLIYTNTHIKYLFIIYLINQNHILRNIE